MSELSISPIPTNPPNISLTPPPLVPAPNTTNPPRLRNFFFVLLLLIFVGISGYLYLQTRSLRSQLAPSPVPSATPVSSADPTSTWQTYSVNGISFKYPGDWTLTGNDGNQPVITLEKTDPTQPKAVYPNEETLDATYHIIITLPPNKINVPKDAERYDLNGLHGYKFQEGAAPSSGPETVVVITNNKLNYVISYGAFANLDTHTKYISVFDQILSTFKFTINSPDARYSGSLQEYLQKNCKKSNPYHIELDQLPISFDENILRTSPRPDGHVAYCSSTDPNSLKEIFVGVNLSDNRTVYIYDAESNELGHGGPPFLGHVGTEIYKTDNITITAIPTYGDGASSLGDFGINLRGIIDFVPSTGKPFSIVLSKTGISGKDARVINYLRPYVTQEYSPGFDMIDSQKLNTDAFIKYFFDSPNKNSVEYLALEDLKKELSAISVR